ncbi:MAG: hypothetical protein WC160_00695 [Bacilli bacterium]
MKSEAYLVAKMFSENYMVYRALSYYGDTIDGKYKSRVEFDHGFLVEYFDRKYIVRIDYGDDDEKMERFKKSKEFNSSDGCCAW